jgi:hypothetical protein
MYIGVHGICLHTVEVNVNVMQDDFSTLDTPVLLDLLSDYTVHYTKLMKEGLKKDFEICRQRINLIQKELQSRKRNPHKGNAKGTKTSS